MPSSRSVYLLVEQLVCTEFILCCRGIKYSCLAATASCKAPEVLLGDVPLILGTCLWLAVGVMI